MTYRRATGNRAFHFNDAFVRAIDPNSLASEKGTENRSSGNIKDPTIKIYVKQRGRQRRELPRTKEENDLLSFSALQLKAETAQFATVRTADPRHTGLQQGSCTDRISIIITIIQLSASLHWNSVMGKAVGRGRGAKPRETFGTHTKMPGVDAYSSMLRSLGRIAAWTSRNWQQSDHFCAGTESSMAMFVKRAFVARKVRESVDFWLCPMTIAGFVSRARDALSFFRAHPSSKTLSCACRRLQSSVNVT